VKAIRAEYFLSFAVMGSLLPYLSIFLSEQGLSDAEIGRVLSLQGVAVIVTPAVVALLADTRMSGRALLAWVYGLTSVALLLMLAEHSYWTLLVTFAWHALTFAPIHALHDGVTFSAFDTRTAAGLPNPPYHRIRVFGTVGFILPSLVLYVALTLGAPVGASMVSAAAFCLLGMANTALLPKTGGVKRAPAGRVPTIAAARALLAPRLLGFCAALFLLNLATSLYYGFYPRYVTDPAVVGIDERWMGLISSLGVTIEIVFMLGFALLVRRLTLRGFAVFAAGSMVLRMALLGLYPVPAIAIGTQVLHGLQVLVMHVLPPTFLNRAAGPGFRSSIQGVYAMAVYGLGRIVGSVLAGELAEWSLTRLFLVGAGLCAAAIPLLWWSLPGLGSVEDEQPSSAAA